MLKLLTSRFSGWGVDNPRRGAYPPWIQWLGAGVCGVLALACSSEDEAQRTLDPVVVGMTADMDPTYDDGEVRIYEVKLPVGFPVVQPTEAQRSSLASVENTPNYLSHYPWVTNADLQVQITWTLTNLDAEDHNVWLLIDPWNEYGRYWPGFTLDDEELIPNYSGIQLYFEVPGTASGRETRRHGTFTFEDMNELAIDFATVMNLIANPPPSEDPDGYEGLATYANHAFNTENRSYNDLYVKGYIPGLIPGLTGIDIGLRTHAPANVAIEIGVEVVDKGNQKVHETDLTPWPEPAEFITVGTAAGM
jgi:hypothetical protein